MAPRRFAIVVAATAGRLGIGRDGGLPWRLKGEMAYFRRVTSTTFDPARRNAVIMGRRTWESIPEKHRPLKSRLSVVVTSRPAAVDGLGPDVRAAASVREALEGLATGDDARDVESVFVVGGEGVFREALAPGLAGLCSGVYLTRVLAEIECDTFFAGFRPERFAEESVSRVHDDPDGGPSYEFVVLRPRADSVAAAAASPPGCVNPEERQYLDLVRDIIDGGVVRGDRTGTGTVSKFGAQMRFSLRDGVFPLLTTKRTFFRGVAEELLWFVAGCTDARKLQERNVRIWDGNASREFLDSVGLTDREEGDLGPIYSFQWRHFGAEYTDMHADYTGQGVDQLAEAIRKIKESPNDRRIIVSAWNPSDLGKMALPPCHMFFQFYVADGELSCQMYQRSCDMGLGVPFNIASYALLTRMVAQVCGLRAGEFVHTLGDAHVYSNHVEALREQLKREPRAFPRLRINPDVTDIDGFKYEDFTLEGYDPYPKIAMKMAV